MAKISLRSYNHEIEILIDRGQIDEAIAHCRHILQSFPKHVGTYRLLGKAYLESQRYSDAGDILQRVLSSVPEDFVSHVGMSIIREDEGNLDEAIWHMERAFEMQPANHAIQDELRRLYGRREGLEPKIRLTRGALARMYLRGELYQQAIAEVRAALNEDPQRLDLQSLLAQAYARSGQRVEAVETANKVLRSLPYCLEANRILAEILASSERADEAKAYLQRLSALDPYFAFLTPAAQTPDKVADHVVALEKLDYHPGQSSQAVSQPEWAASLGVDVGDLNADKEPLPDWLAQETAEPSNGDLTWGAPTGEGDFSELEPGGPTESPAELTPEDEIPDWMKSVGWAPATGEEKAEPSAFAVEEVDSTDSEELANAEIPEWLRSLSPENSNPEEESQPQAFGAELDWLEPSNTLAPDPTSAEDQTPAPESDITQEKIPDWLSDVVDQESEAEAQPADLPDWLQAVSEPEAQPAEESAPEDIPDWLSALDSARPLAMGEDLEAVNESTDTAAEARTEETEPSLDTGDTDAAFAWLESLAVKQGADEALLLPPEERAEQPPEWVLSAAEEEAPGEQFEETAQLEEAPVIADDAGQDAFGKVGVFDIPNAGGWNNEPQTVASDEEPAPEAEEPVPSSSAETIPSWLSELTGPEEPETIEAPSETTSTNETLPSRLSELEEPPLVEGDTKPVRVHPISEAPEPAEAPQAAELPDWLKETIPTPPEGIGDLVNEQEVLGAEFDQPAAIEAEPASQIPEWLRGFDTQAEDIEQVDEAPVSEAKPVEESDVSASSSEMDTDAAFAWLESLAVKQGAEEALLLKPEDRLESAPEWVQESIQSDEAEISEGETTPEPFPAVEEPAPVETETIEEPANADLPEWLKELTAEVAETEETIGPAFTPPSNAAVYEVPAPVEPEEGAQPESPAVREPVADIETPVVSEAAIEYEVAAEEQAGATQSAADTGASYSETLVEHEAIPDLPDWLAEAGAEPEAEPWVPPQQYPQVEPVDINRASLVELERLPGVGFILAQAIVSHREQHGPFKKVEDLEQVSNFNPALLQELKPYFTLPVEEKPVQSEPVPQRADEPQAPISTSTPGPALTSARTAMETGNVAQAASQYSQLIKAKQSLPELINDLQAAVESYPQDVSLWQALGDALLRVDRLQEALDAYTRAEELLR